MLLSPGWSFSLFHNSVLFNVLAFFHPPQNSAEGSGTQEIVISACAEFCTGRTSKLRIPITRRLTFQPILLLDTCLRYIEFVVLGVLKWARSERIVVLSAEFCGKTGRDSIRPRIFPHFTPLRSRLNTRRRANPYPAPAASIRSGTVPRAPRGSSRWRCKKTLLDFRAVLVPCSCDPHV